MAPRYAIRSTITRKGENSYIARAVVECVDGRPLEKLRELEPCKPCSYAQARSAAYRFIAKLSYEVRKAGGDVLEVTIWDIPPASTPYHAIAA